jgi:UDP-N-acetylglucosamine 4,6-dehydratase
MVGGELFVPKLPSMKMVDLAQIIAPECETKIVGIRPGEKLHEVMIPADDAHHTLEYDDYYVILPEFHDWDARQYVERNGGKPCPDGFCYSSDTNTQWLSAEELQEMIGVPEAEKIYD